MIPDPYGLAGWLQFLALVGFALFNTLAPFVALWHGLGPDRAALPQSAPRTLTTRSASIGADVPVIPALDWP
jgi:hypothetical protein